ncbi:MAG: replicative DNA helicase [Clostridiales bacterium]|jgi:replicative DNA helicase|nr:replicative DNA helicase [Clostridiales bacterium]
MDAQHIDYDIPIDEGFAGAPSAMAHPNVRQLPFNIEAEQNVLASMMLNKEALGQGIQLVSHNDFYSNANEEIFLTLLSLYNSEMPVDIITMTEDLKKRGELEKIGGIDYLVMVANTTAISTNLVYYANIVRQKSILRKLISTTEEILNTGYKEQGDAFDILDYAEQKVFSLRENTTSAGEFIHVSDVISENYERLLELSKTQEPVHGIPTGFKHLDDVLLGLHEGNLILVAARPAMGKTSFALNIALQAAQASGKSIAVFSLEMTRTELVNRLWSSETYVELEKIQSGNNLVDRDWQALTEGMERVAKVPIYIDDSGSPTVVEMRAKCRRLKRDKGLGLIIIDHMQLMQNAGRRGDNRQAEVSEISRQLKLLAKDLGVPVMVLSQLNRKAEERMDKRPVLSDLRESGAIEQDADVVMLLYRDDYYNPESERPGVAECIIAKHRNGATGTIELGWSAKLTKFKTIDFVHSNVPSGFEHKSGDSGGSSFGGQDVPF